MLNDTGFDTWANSYEAAIAASDKENSYPFAGYKKLMNAIHDIIIAQAGAKVLDVGIGTGLLSGELYKKGFQISGLDFSDVMLEICRAKMPSARLYRHDFSQGLPPEIQDARFDFIICTYAIHHLSDDTKPGFIQELVGILKNGGRLIIGDVAFGTRAGLEECKAKHIDDWDDEEYYLVYDEIKPRLPAEYEVSYEQVSSCAGLLMIGRAT